MTRWRVFVGDPHGDWTHIDRAIDAYEDARAILAERLAPFLADTCEDCRQAGTRARLRLLDLPAESEFAAEVDGEAYLLVSADRDIDGPGSLWDAVTDLPLTDEAG